MVSWITSTMMKRRVQERVVAMALFWYCLKTRLIKELSVHFARKDRGFKITRLLKRWNAKNSSNLGILASEVRFQPISNDLHDKFTRRSETTGSTLRTLVE